MSSCNIVKVHLQVSLTYFDHKKETVVLVHESTRRIKKMLLSHPEHSQTPRNDMQILSARCFAVVVVACEKFRSYLFGRVDQITNLLRWFTWRILQLSRRPKAPENVAQNTRIWLHCQVKTWHRNAFCSPNFKTKPSTKWRVIGPTQSSAIPWWEVQCTEARHLV